MSPSATALQFTSNSSSSSLARSAHILAQPSHRFEVAEVVAVVARRRRELAEISERLETMKASPLFAA